MGKPQPPCKGCEPPTRFPGCHDKCEIYQEYKKAKLEFNLQLAIINNYDVYVREKKANQWEKNVKKKQRGEK